MKMLTRLRYLLNEGFEVGKISGYDATHPGEEFGHASITFVQVLPGGARRLITEDFSVDAREAEECSRLFLESNKDIENQ